ncbi:MAG TPA: serine/threonine-protein kinase [Planctomycetota bacterium]|nr:serine/threonine-protein kinase [Planctomycetota bacterium]
MSTQADFDFGNALVELDLAPLDVVRDALKTLKESTRKDDSLERILLEKRIISHEQSALARRRLKGTQPVGAPEIPNYQILDVLGSGGAGTVYRARQVSMDRIVAIKVLLPRLAKDQAYLDRFFREAKAAAKLSHPNLIVAHDVGAHQGTYYMVMEYVSGATLQQLLDSQGSLEESRVIDVAIQVARALEVAHRNAMVHRDVKPGNIILSSDGQVKLFDLGLAREGVGASEGRAVGTPRYISPEQAKDSPNIDIRSDLYSLGATMYHLVTGQIPFKGETGAQMLAKHVAERLVPAHVRNTKVTQELSAVISRLMEKNPDNRIQRPADLIAALESIRSRRAKPAPKAAVVGISAPTPRPVPMPMRPPSAYRRDHRGGGGKFFLVAVVLGLAAAGWFFRDRIFETVESRDLSRLTRTGPTEAEKAAAEEAARKELEEIEAQARADSGFVAMDAILQSFDDYRRRHRNTTWETAATDRRLAYIAKADVVADGELRRIRERAGELLAAGKDRDVYELYAKFPARFIEITQAGPTVKEELKNLKDRISEKFTADKQQLQERLRERKYEEALGLLSAMEEYALPDQVLELAERRRALEGLRRVGEGSASAVEVRDKYLLFDGPLRDLLANKRFREAVQGLRDLLFGPWSDAERPFVRVGGVDYDALKAELDAKPPDLEKLLARIEAGMGDPANLAEATTAQSILLDLRNAVSLELFKARVNEGMERTTKAATHESWVAEGLGKKKGYYERRGTAIFWVPEGQKAFELDPWLRLAEVDLVGLAARSYGLDRAGAEAEAEKDPVFHLRAGLLHNFAGKGTLGAAHAERHFKAAAQGGVKGVKVYLSDLSAALSKLSEQEAAARLAEAKGLIAQNQASTARKILEELSARTGVKFVEEHRAEIDKMLTDIRESLTKGKKYEEAFRGKIEPVDDKRIRVFYDFTDRAQGEMFELVTMDGKLKGRWKTDGGVMEAQKGTSVSSASRWKHQINGDVEVEYDLVAMEDPQNIATDLYFKPGSDKYYGVTFGIDFVVGEMEQIMQIPNTAVIKYPTSFQPARAKLPAEWDKLRASIIGTAVTDFRLEKKKKVRVKIERIAKALTVSVDGKPVWQAEDIDYRTGYLLFFSDCRAQIDNLAITLTP